MGGWGPGRAPSLTCWMVGSPARLVRRLRMLRSDIWRRAATGGMRDSMEGRRVTSAFMSLSSSSSWFRTGEEGREGEELRRGRPGRCLLTRLCYRVTCTPRSGRQGAPLLSPPSKHIRDLPAGPESRFPNSFSRGPEGCRDESPEL